MFKNLTLKTKHAEKFKNLTDASKAAKARSFYLVLHIHGWRSRDKICAIPQNSEKTVSQSQDGLRTCS